MLNTLKTTLGFLAAVVEKYTPLTLGNDTLEDTYNYLKISDSLATSGQPTEKQFHAISKAGYQSVINLAPNSVLENSLQTEASLLAQLGIDYIHIPVDFVKPTTKDFDKFTRALQTRSQQKVWVHCAANMRVSAFIYRYRIAVLGESESLAKNDLEKIWTPIGVWKHFISKARRQNK